MPPSDLHTKKFKKNLAVLALIFGFCALFFLVTLIRLKMGSS